MQPTKNPWPITRCSLLIACGLALGACKSTNHTNTPRASGDSSAVESAAPQAEPIETPISDDTISDTVMNRLMRDHAIEAGEVAVRTTDGIVELSGAVDAVLTKDRAARIAELVKGVRAVSNQLDVKPDIDRGDAEIRSDVVLALAVDPAAESYEVEVEVDDGVVSLIGTVDSWQEKTLAERVTKGVKGVREVRNQIEVDYEMERSDEEIAKDIEQRLRWDILVDDALIDVSVDAGAVRLSGVAGSAAERSRAFHDAWVAGVLSVEHDDLEVERWARDPMLRENKYAVRTDEEIARAVESAALYDPRVVSFDIEPVVTAGVVELRGTVDNLEARRAAEQIARHTVGVIDVENRITVESPTPIADAVLEARVRDALIRNPITELDDVALSAENGAVTLRGTVAHYLEKAEAERVAERVRGVLVVDNQLAVTDTGRAFVYDPYLYPHLPFPADPWTAYVPAQPLDSDEHIEDQIQRELYWSPFVDHTQVHVKVTDGRAELSGTVETWRERAEATENAYEGGAVTVDNEIDVH